MLVGLFTRLAAVPLVVDMIVAIATTKLPLLFGAGPEPVAAPPKTGFWAFAYQARLDATMLLSCVYLVAIGAGLWSIDALLARRRWEGALLGSRVRDRRDAPHPAEVDVRPPPAVRSLDSRAHPARLPARSLEPRQFALGRPAPSPPFEDD